MAGAFWVPAYKGSTCEGTSFGPTRCSSTTASFVSENGGWSVLWFVLPAVAAVVSWFLLRRGCNGGRQWNIMSVLMLSSFGFFVSMLAASIGLLELPVALLLVASALLVGQQRGRVLGPTG